MLLRARQFEFQFPRPAMLIGIVNVTPDSFSDGGKFFDPQLAIAQSLKLIVEGAEILDIGGESTRPGAAPVSEEEELRRVLPVIRGIVASLPQSGRALISIDTMKPLVARAAIEAGASLINDVASNPALWPVVRETGAGYVLMHRQGTPQTMQANPHYDDVLATVQKFFEERLAALLAAGVEPEQIILDPGIGFGKTAEHNLDLLANLAQFRNCRRPLLVGVSRKAFIGQIGGIKDATERMPGSLACACAAVTAGAQIIRTHDVAATWQALRLTEAVQSKRK